MHPKNLEIAEIELRETESRKCQALQQFRDWIEKNQFLVSTRRDDMFLLIFLRLTKYNVDKACQRYEKTYTIVKKYPNYFFSNFDHLEKCLDVVRSGYIYPVPGFDDDGCKILIVRISERDPDKLSVPLVTETGKYIMTCLFNEHENQICKYKFIIDFNNVVMKQMLTPMDHKVLLESLSSALSFRISKYILINTSPVVTGIIELVKMLVSEKIRNRTIVLKNQSELGKHIQPISMLPTKYNGDKDEAEITKDFTRIMAENRELMIKSSTWELDMKKLPKSKLEKDEFEHVGSFLKLEID